MRGLKRWTITPLTSGNDGPGQNFHMVADLYAEDQAAMQRILESDAGRAAREDVANFATGGVVFLEGYEEEIELP
jgi:uncharacterized protein (TIGR02118 family)